MNFDFHTVICPLKIDISASALGCVRTAAFPSSGKVSEHFLVNLINFVARREVGGGKQEANERQVRTESVL